MKINISISLELLKNILLYSDASRDLEVVREKLKRLEDQEENEFVLEDLKIIREQYQDMYDDMCCDACFILDELAEEITNS